jgi:porin
MVSSRRLLPAFLSAPALFWTFPAMAQSAAPAAVSAGLWSRTNLLGDMGGLRSILGKYGGTLSITDSENLLGNLAGGVKQGATMQGVTTGTLEIDTGKAFGLEGGTFHVSGLQIHGQSLSGPYLDNLQAANGNEAEDTTRIWELWYDHAFLGSKFDIKVGQQSIDNEFIISQNSGLFINTMAGWPLVPSVDLYGGGPAYPLSSLGVRLQAKPTDSIAILAGVFDDNPDGGAFSADAQELDKHGAKFNLNTGALFISELQYATKIRGLSGTYKIGGWFDTGLFPDQRFDTDGLSLANPESNGDPLMHHGNYSLYAVADQTVWQSKKESSRSLNLFGRIMGAPVNQNLVDFFFNGGVTLTAPFSGRDNDQAGIDFGIGSVSPRVSEFDRDSGLPSRGTEELVEVTYQAQVTGWLVVQPDLQYVDNPGGGLLNPNDPTQKLRNEFIAGARAIVTF